MTSPRKAWLAALLSFLQPGIGQLYNGRVAKSFAAQIGVPASIVPVLWLVIEFPVAPINVLFLLGLPVVVALVAAEAFADARRLRDRPRPWYSRWWSCAAMLSLNAVVFGPMWQDLLRNSWVQAVSHPAASMAPTILAGDRVFIDKACYGVRIPYLERVVGQRLPRRGDIVGFFSPHDRKRLLKRIVALPGERVEGRRHIVYVDGKAIDEPYVSYSEGVEADSEIEFRPVTVPADHLFVLGDNRSGSFDSRHFGFLAVGDVFGRAKLVYFSWDSSTQRPRWERIGYRLQ